MSDTPRAGWYPDPSDPQKQRYWDGTQWTEHTADLQPSGESAPASGSGGGAVSWPEATSQPPARAGGSGAPQTWLWQSIVATLFCCLPAGVVGIIYAAQAQSAVSTGDFATATQKANTARTWTLVSVGLGLLTIVVVFAFGLIGAVSDVNSF